MKILENRPKRYDTWINILSGGHSKRIRDKIVRENVLPGINLLDLGCGTGSLLIEAAKAGAVAEGIDISENMLAIARRKIDQLGMQNKIRVYNSGIAELDSIFKENKFDLIVSTLVFSELYSEERALAYKQIKKLLKPDGRFILASEVQPGSLPKRILHFLIRLPLVILTYLIAQTGAKPLAGLKDELINAGFEVASEDRSFLDSFILLSAHAADTSSAISDLPPGIQPEKDRSFFKTIWDFIGRWFPCPVEPGLRIIGDPDRKSEIIVTSNFHLTVRRVEKSLKNENVYLLAAPSNGINVWCASCGGELNTHSVISVLKTSRMDERVDRKRIILPLFSAPSIDRQLLKSETGWMSRFGPAYSKDIPAYLKNKKTNYEHNRAEFPLLFRLEMLFSMNFLVWVLLGVIVSLVSVKIFLLTSALFWMSGLILFAGFPIIPGASGWLKSIILSAIYVIAIAIISIFIFDEPLFSRWGIMIISTVINLWLGFDLRGIVSGEPSEAEWLMHKIGAKSFGHLFTAGKFSPGKINQNTEKCNNCRICLIVCPKSVYEITEEDKVRIKNKSECFACSACVTQCEPEALFLG